jgi:hypothetical protein
MPIILAEKSASAAALRREGIEVLHEPPAQRPTRRVGLLNLMLDKLVTEVQFARLLGASSHNVKRRFVEGPAASLAPPCREVLCQLALDPDDARATDDGPRALGGMIL